MFVRSPAIASQPGQTLPLAKATAVCHPRSDNRERGKPFDPPNKHLPTGKWQTPPVSDASLTYDHSAGGGPAPPQTIGR